MALLVFCPFSSDLIFMVENKNDVSHRNKHRNTFFLNHKVDNGFLKEQSRQSVLLVKGITIITTFVATRTGGLSAG